MLSIDHYNKNDLIVTVPFDKIIRGTAYYRYNKVNPLEVVKSNFTVEMLTKHFELKNSYEAELFISINSSTEGRTISIVLTKK